MKARLGLQIIICKRHNFFETQVAKGVEIMTTNSQLQTDLRAELKWQPKIDAAHIGVTAHNNVITLSGQVAHYVEKSAAEASAKGVYGVKAVANEIEVELNGTSSHSDQDIAEAALNAMKWDYEVPADKINVLVKNGYVSLEGTVDWEYQRDAASRVVKHLLGVKSVINAIAIEPTVVWGDVKNAIEDSLKRSAELDARRIGVDTHNGTVTLTGSVSSLGERDHAVAAAWGAPGVKLVKDDLLISF